MAAPNSQAPQTVTPSADTPLFHESSIIWDEESLAALYARIGDTPDCKCYLCGEFIDCAEELRVHHIQGEWPNGEPFDRVWPYHVVCLFPPECEDINMPVRNILDVNYGLLDNNGKPQIPETTPHPKLGWYRHYKEGTPYEVVGFCRRENTLEICVLYRNDACGDIPWERTLSDFCATVEIAPQCVTSRFTYDQELNELAGYIEPEEVGEDAANVCD